ncbi:hypothetical protein ACM66T_10220 [Sulfurimonas sp. ST-25]|uniref:head-tail joining protein n=1 Tax=Sulfurimonas sp. ST-25 TaxID=3400151 RepID=UPI003A8A90EF
MSFMDMAAGDLDAFYETLGDDASVSIGGGEPFAVKVIPDDDMLVEYAEFDIYRVIASKVPGIDTGDTLTIGTVDKTIRSAKPSRDGSEIYVGVDK